MANDKPPLVFPRKTRRLALTWNKTTTLWAAILLLVAVLSVGWTGRGALGAIVEAPTRLDKIVKRMGTTEKMLREQQWLVREQQIQGKHLHEEIQQTRQDLRYMQSGEPLPRVDTHDLPSVTPVPVPLDLEPEP